MLRIPVALLFGLLLVQAPPQRGTPPPAGPGQTQAMWNEILELRRRVEVLEQKAGVTPPTATPARGR